MYVVVDGPTLSLLLYSHFNSKGKEMGFLLGQNMEKVQSGITDSQMHTAEVHSYIYVTSFIPWPRHKCLYGRNGHIDETLMNSIREGSDERVVGWYSFRHQTSQMASMKEFSIHSELTEKCQAVKPEEFVFLLCTSLANRNLSTHSSDHTFMVCRSGRFAHIPMTVKNLGDTSKMEYIVENSSPATSKVISANMGNSGKNFVVASGQVKQVADMKHLISSMTKGLESTQSKVNNSEAVLRLLETEVSALRDRVALLEKEEMQRAFRKAELQKQKEEEEKKQVEKNQEAEEEEQMNKLLMELGLTTPKPTSKAPESAHPEQNSSMSPAPAIISLPKLEAGINPLYVSTLIELEGQEDMSAGSRSSSDIPNNHAGDLLIANHQSSKKVHLLNNKSEKLSSSTASVGSNANAVKESLPSAMKMRSKPKDPFDFVTEEVKSELNTTNNKQGRQTRGILQNHSRAAESSRSPSPAVKAAPVVRNKTMSDNISNINNTDGAVSMNAAANAHVSSDELDEHDGPPGQPQDAPNSQSSSSAADGVVTVSSSPVF